MSRRQPSPQRPPPRLWLMTDERVADAALLGAAARLPRGSGIVFRHYSLSAPARRALFEKVRAIARRRGVVLLLAGPERQAVAWRADGFHGRAGRRHRHLLRSVSAHGMAEIRRAERAGAHLLFLSPLFPTRSHPGGRTLGRVRFGLLARQAHVPVIALGGMTAARAEPLRGLRAHGWAAIDALS